MKPTKVLPGSPLVSAEGWWAFHFHPGNGKVIDRRRVVLWAVRNDGQIVGLCPGGNGVWTAEDSEQFQYEYHPDQWHNLEPWPVEDAPAGTNG